MTVSFHKALIGSCSGLKIFSSLQEQKLWRAILHLLLMAVIASGIIMLGAYSDVKRVAARSLDLLDEHCGGIKISSSRIEPLRGGDKSFRFVLAGPLAVTYLPEINDQTLLSKDMLQGADMGVIWLPEKMVLFWLLPGDRCSFINLSSAVESMGGAASSETNFADLAKIIAKMPGWKFQEIDKEATVTADALRKMVEAGLLPLLWVMFFRQTILEVIIYIAMFSVVFTLMNLRRPRRMKFKTVLVLAIYAGFPAMIIGAMAGALKLAWIDFNLVYVLGMTLYLITVINYLERERQFQEWMNNNLPRE